jgi:UPF0755 protein
VASGSSTTDIAELLESKHVISNSTLFRYYVKWKSAKTFEAGDYDFHEHSSFGDALAILKKGPLAAPTVKLTVPPGLTLPEIIKRITDQLPGLSSDALNQLLVSGQVRSKYLPAETNNAEGFLFPDTYQIPEGAHEADVVAALAHQFDAVGDEIGLAAAPARVGLSPYQVVIVASLIEREAKIPADEAKIARVIYNRLAQNIPLGVDASLCYILAEKPCSLTRSDLNSTSPYNTRKVAGLPPTPIAAPAKAALVAALNPEPGPWLYYVLDASLQATQPGAHFFTDDINAFNKKKAECQAAGLC